MQKYIHLPIALSRNTSFDVFSGIEMAASLCTEPLFKALLDAGEEVEIKGEHFSMSNELSPKLFHAFKQAITGLNVE